MAIAEDSPSGGIIFQFVNIPSCNTICDIYVCAWFAGWRPRTDFGDEPYVETNSNNSKYAQYHRRPTNLRVLDLILL